MIAESQLDGALMCARYAFMPNKLKYCGGNKNSELLEYGTRLYQDPGLNGILEEFETMYPYLKFIAGKNNIKNPFDKKVVEAYWIGNSLLKNISLNEFYKYLSDTLGLKKKLGPKLFEKVVGVIPKGALPHHSFHVISVPKRTGHYPVEHTVETMDKCRIGFGKVVKVTSDTSTGLSTDKVQVTREPLIMRGDQIIFGKKETKDYIWQIGEKSFVKNIKKGDWVSLHWDFVCDVLSERQVRNLNYYSQMSMDVVNSEKL